MKIQTTFGEWDAPADQVHQILGNSILVITQVPEFPFLGCGMVLVMNRNHGDQHMIYRGGIDEAIRGTMHTRTNYSFAEELERHGELANLQAWVYESRSMIDLLIDWRQFKARDRAKWSERIAAMVDAMGDVRNDHKKLAVHRLTRAQSLRDSLRRLNPSRTGNLVGFAANALQSREDEVMRIMKHVDYRRVAMMHAAAQAEREMLEVKQQLNGRIRLVNALRQCPRSEVDRRAGRIQLELIDLMTRLSGVYHLPFRRIAEHAIDDCKEAHLAMCQVIEGSDDPEGNVDKAEQALIRSKTAIYLLFKYQRPVTMIQSAISHATVYRDTEWRQKGMHGVREDLESLLGTIDVDHDQVLEYRYLHRFKRRIEKALTAWPDGGPVTKDQLDQIKDHLREASRMV